MKNNTTILITGITGQDGIFLTNELLKKYKKIDIYGTTRKSNNTDYFKKLRYLSPNLNLENINLVNIDLNNFKSIRTIISETRPDSIYNFSGPSSVYKSINQSKIPQDINNIFKNLTKACVDTRHFPNFYQASSSEMYGTNSEHILDEKSEFLPNSPYAKSKLINHNLVQKLRLKYDWNIVSGIMFNHESEFRQDDYLFMKIINYILNIQKSEDQLVLGSLKLSRDWSYAEDIVEGIVDMTESKLSKDYVLGSGVPTTIKDLLEISFGCFNLKWENYVEIDKNILRNNDPDKRISNPKLIHKDIGWKTKTSIEKIINKIIKYKTINN